MIVHHTLPFQMLQHLHKHLARSSHQTTRFDFVFYHVYHLQIIRTCKITLFGRTGPGTYVVVLFEISCWYLHQLSHPFELLSCYSFSFDEAQWKSTAPTHCFGWQPHSNFLIDLPWNPSAYLHLLNQKLPVLIFVNDFPLVSGCDQYILFWWLGLDGRYLSQKQNLYCPQLYVTDTSTKYLFHTLLLHCWSRASKVYGTLMHLPPKFIPIRVGYFVHFHVYTVSGKTCNI